MIIRPSHIEAARYKALKGSSWLRGLVMLDTETKAYTRVVPSGNDLVYEDGVADAIYYRPPGQDEWEEING